MSLQLLKITRCRRETEQYFFEQWAAELGYPLEKYRGNSYTDGQTEDAWNAWLARARMDLDLTSDLKTYKKKQETAT